MNRLVLETFLFLVVVIRSSLSFDFQCSSQISMDPETGGRPQYVGENPPPYMFSIFKENGESVKRYKEEVYTIRLNSSSSYFRGFLIQARLATKHGHIVGGYRAGEFLLDDGSESKGVKYFACASALNDSITHSNDDKKTVIEAKWIEKKNEGPIQFLITIIQEQEMYWVSWAPKSGLIFPAKKAKFSAQATTSLPDPGAKSDGNDDAKLMEKPDVTIAVPETTTVMTTEKPKDTTVPMVKTTRMIPKENIEEEEEHPSPPATEEPAAPAVNENSDKFNEQMPKRVPSAGSKTGERFIVSSDVSSIGANATNGKDSGKKPPSGDDKSSPVDNFNVPEGLTHRTPRPKRPIDPSIPQHIVDEHIIETKENITEPPELDMCENDPCFHNGTCESFPGERRFACTCNGQWVGEQCEEKNVCFQNECKNSGACVMGDNGDYTCQCQSGYGGRRCEFTCPSYLCQNGGSCNLDSRGGYICNCKPGWTGDKCDKQADACASNPCLNGGNCTNKITEFECKCKPGYMGDTCHRACQDVYKSCEFWKQEDKCDLMRPTTSFFDINCPVSCDQCTYDNSTINTKEPLPFLLEPFAFLIGVWYMNYSSPMRYPLDFDVAPEGYSEELSFLVPPVNMFGTPYLNYSAKSYNKAYRGEAQINYGFVTLKPVTDPLKVAIMSTGNDGLTMVEEGDIKPNRLSLTTKFMVAFPGVEKIPLKLSRKFYYDGNYLEERVQRIRADSVMESFSRYYTKHVVTPFY